MSQDLVGIVLMGGQSSRMGKDKAMLEVGTEKNTLAEIAYEKLKCYTSEVYFSVNKTQETYNLPNTILDNFEKQGPLSGIISALRLTQSSILLLGVDMPLIRKQTIKSLIKNRNWDLLTTTYYDSETQKWQPMLSIWEIETLPCLEKYFEEGGRSIQKFLNSFGNQRVPITNYTEFVNVNRPEDYEKLITGG